MRVAEHEPAAVDRAEQLLLPRPRLGHEALHVRDRRAVAVERPVAGEALGQRGQLAHELGAEQLRAALDRALHGLGRVVRRRGPPLAVAADPLRVELAQPLDRLARPRAEQGVVAAEHPRVDVLRVGQDGLERRQVPVDVVEQAERHPAGIVSLCGAVRTLGDRTRPPRHRRGGQRGTASARREHRGLAHGDPRRPLHDDADRLDSGGRGRGRARARPRRRPRASSAWARSRSRRSRTSTASFAPRHRTS